MKKTLATVLLSALLLTGVAIPQRVEAFSIGPIVLDPINLIQNTLSYVVGDKLSFKEYILDQAAFLLANTSLETMTQDIVAWVNGGLQGSPLFVQNLSQYLTQIEDLAAEDFFAELDGGFFEGPNTGSIRAALEQAFHLAQGSDLADRFTPLYKNIEQAERFIDGDFSAGGFDQFFEVFGVPQNNPYLASIDLKAELDKQVDGAREEEKTALDWSDGFRSYRECRDGEDGVGCTGDVLTPGAVISSQLNESLALGGKRLANADELNEILGAFLTQMVQEALGGAGGLFGVTGSRNGGSSLVDRTRDDPLPTDAGEGLESQIQKNISDGRELMTTLDASLSLVRSGISQIDTHVCGAGNLQSIRVQLTTYEQSIISEQTRTESALRDLQQLLGTLLLSEDRETYLEATQTYQSLLARGIIPDQSDVVQAGLDQTDIQGLVDQIAAASSSCTP